MRAFLTAKTQSRHRRPAFQRRAKNKAASTPAITTAMPPAATRIMGNPMRVSGCLLSSNSRLKNTNNPTATPMMATKGQSLTLPYPARRNGHQDPGTGAASDLARIETGGSDRTALWIAESRARIGLVEPALSASARAAALLARTSALGLPIRHDASAAITMKIAAIATPPASAVVVQFHSSAAQKRPAEARTISPPNAAVIGS